MAIHPLNSDQANIPLESRAISFSNSHLIQKLTDPELKALIEQYLNQPLLLEKFLLQKGDNALITLKLNPLPVINNHQANMQASQFNVIQLKLPTEMFSTETNLTSKPVYSQSQPQAPIQAARLIEIKTLIELFKNAEKIAFSIGNNQQLVIKILNSNQQSQSLSSNVQMNFTRAERSAKGELILSQLLEIKTNNTIINRVQTSLVKTVDLSKNLGEIASSLISSISSPNSKLSNDFLRMETTSGQIKEKLSSILDSSNIINRFIKQLENIAIKKDVILDMKTIELTKTSLIDFIQKLNKINIEIQKSLETITKPLALENFIQKDTVKNTENLVSRIIKSGNLFENALKQQVEKNDISQLNNPSKIPSDNKLLFNQINIQLEKLLVEINRYSEKPVSISQIERIERMLSIQIKDFTPLEKHQLEINKTNTIQKIQLQQEQFQNVIRFSKLLQEIIKNGLQKIEQNQLHSLKSEQFNLQQFLIDLPIKQNGMIDSFEMRFESQSKNNNSVKNKYWKVVVRFDLEPLGPMFAEIQFENEKISTHLFAEKKETASLINQHLPTLKKSLFSAGVDVNRVSGSQGNIPENLRNQDKPSIDTHA